MLSSFLIALREGFEAALIVGILVAYLAKSNRRENLPWLWSGVGIAAVLSLITGALLSYTGSGLSDRGEALFAGVTSFAAATLVTGMIFWMKKAGRALRGELHEKMGQALMAGPFAIALTAFLSVAREGLETALFLYSNFKSEADPLGSTVGLVAGLAVAILLGLLVYRSAIRFNMSTFFTYTGIGLIIIVGNIISYGYHELAELAIVPESALYQYGLALAYIAATTLLYIRKAPVRELERV